MRLNKYFLLLLTICSALVLPAQTKEDLKKQKIEIENEIRYTTELLHKTEANKTRSLSYLKVLESKIRSKEQLLVTLNIEINLLVNQIYKTGISITKTELSIIQEEKNLQKLKEEYAKMIYAAFKQQGNRNNIMFIISSDNFNQAYKRILYLKQYSVFRRNQSIRIVDVKMKLIKKKEKLFQQNDRLIEESTMKTLLVTSKRQELVSVSSIKNDKQYLLKKLSKSQKIFRAQLQDNQKKSKELDNKILLIIEEEIRKSIKTSINKNGNKSHNLTPENLALSSDFIGNKGSLPWPLEKGVIIARYGTQKHPVFTEIETFNNGIDIATDRNTIVRAIFDGVVSRIFFIKGDGKAVLINHGEYFSVYSGLKEVSVKAGDHLLSKQKIGVVMTHEEEKKTELHFELWKGYDKLDPSYWLYNAI